METARAKAPQAVSTARDEILARVRSAVGRQAGQPPGPRPALSLDSRNLPVAERIELFIRSFETLGGVAMRLPRRSDVRPALEDVLKGRSAVASNASYLRECGVTEVVGVQSDLRAADELRGACAQAVAGITSVAYALADTGTLVMVSSEAEPRLISLLPPVHIAVVPALKILQNVDELFIKMPTPSGETSAMVLITGPSRTADIEQILVRGVHGPGEVYALIVEEGA
jgi:L-lactate dehydrogenase complex protein LldG